MLGFKKKTFKVLILSVIYIQITGMVKNGFLSCSEIIQLNYQFTMMIIAIHKWFGRNSKDFTNL